MSVVHKERSALTLSKFKGVDFSSSPFDVASNRAVEMENMINIDGVNQKRPGWECVLNLEGNINGVYYVSATKVLLIHNGKALYAYDNETFEILASINNDNSEVHISDAQSQFFYNDGKVFIICGDVIVYDVDGIKPEDGSIKYFFRIDEHPDVYVPTTCIEIPACESKSNMASGTFFESVNVFTRCRKNTFAPVVVESGKNYNKRYYKLDDAIDRENSIVGTMRLFDQTTNEYWERLIVSNTYDFYKEFYPKTELPVEKEGEGPNYIYLSKVEPEEIVGYVLPQGYGGIYNSIVVTLQNFDCFEITYFARENDNVYVTETPSERIRKCAHGTLFGINGNTNRLFLTGSDSQKNAVYYSGADNFLYFPDNNYITLGNNQHKVTGFLRLLDDTMAAFKDGEGGDTTMYYVKGTLKTVYDASGNVADGESVFMVSAGGTGEKNVNSHTTANLAGDSLMLSENGVYGITFTENTTTNARYAKERSFNISERLRKHKSLSEAVATIYKNRYYLSVDGVCYVADPRFKFYRDEQMEQSYNYEWWYWTGVGARCFCVVDDVLWFGTSDGKICRFKDNGEHTDDTFVELNSPETYFENDRITFSTDYVNFVKDGDECTILGDCKLYSKVVSECKVDGDNVFTVVKEEIFKLRCGETVWAGVIDKENSKENSIESCEITDIDLANCTFKLNGTPKTNADGTFNIYRELNKKKTIVTNLDKEQQSFQLKSSETGDVLYIEGIDPDGDYKIRITHKRNVVSRWVSPYFDMGSNTYSKTLLGMTISAISSVGERIKFGYQTKKGARMTENKGVNAFAFDNTAFDLFSFDTSFADSYTKKVNVRDFNYIRFTFVSDGPHNCAVNNFTALYKINRKNRGVR